jgi:hypothetical protein
MASNLENRLNELIASIDSSQASEKEILQVLQSNSNINEFDIETYINNISKFTEERKSTMREIYDVTRSLEKSTEYNSQEYEQQVKLLLLTEQKLQDLKRKIEILKSDSENKNRNLQITNYYRKYYRAWSTYMSIVFIVVLINVILAYITYLGYMPILVNVILAAVSIMILHLFSSDLYRRDKRIFDEYDWKFDPNDVNITTYTSSEQPIPAEEEVLTENKCSANMAAIASSIEESGGIIQCPEGKIYDEKLYKCVQSTEVEEPVEGYSNYLNHKTVLME